MVKNDGISFPETSDYKKGMGLNIMKYRSRIIGGRFDVKKNPNGGTIVTVRFNPKK